ncbi:MAG TPA: hypothetical protein VMD59_15865 [Acidimicrobiales bacterium]|nr:hypothetical protein [Acidimicrobiales bacterium]
MTHTSATAASAQDAMPLPAGGTSSSRRERARFGARRRIAAGLVAGALGLGAGGSATALALEALAAPPAAAMAMAPVKVTGKITKIISTSMMGSSFKLAAHMKTYVVTCNEMTRIELNGMKVKMSKLKVGDTATVRGPLEMDTIHATSVTVGM